MSIADLVSELVYHLHYSLAEIAGLDDVQLTQVFFRKRDRYGRLTSQRKGRRRRVRVRKPVKFVTMFRDVWRERGLSEEAVEERWQAYLEKNPGLRPNIHGY